MLKFYSKKLFIYRFILLYIVLITFKNRHSQSLSI
uniref:ATP synthase n=1 Tax=Siphoviridae sp. ct4Z13 TaxID=2827778 RepID=A0A8S5SC82_9CAUD|nr:MAG TPA: ATP synthase [Siphoviridae sp. ct4Z13]